MQDYATTSGPGASFDATVWVVHGEWSPQAGMLGTSLCPMLVAYCFDTMHQVVGVSCLSPPPLVPYSYSPTTPETHLFLLLYCLVCNGLLRPGPTIHMSVMMPEARRQRWSCG